MTLLLTIDLEVEFLSYTEVKSEFIKAKIRGSDWNDKFRKNYINDLIELENHVLHKRGSGFAHALYIGGLKDYYKREYDIIFKELAPKEYERLIEEKKQRELKRNEEDEQRRKELKAKKEQLRKEWLEVGGTEQ